MNRRRRSRAGLRQAQVGHRPRWVDYSVTVALFALLILLVARLEEGRLRKAEGTAVVIDGDSLELGAEHVRLRGIDAPEFRQLCTARGGLDYACGVQARGALVRLVGAGPVTCSGTRRDRYGRLLADCIAGGRNLNRELVLQGWAVAYGDFDAEEASAKARGAGIWAGTFVTPQQWRRDRGVAAEPEHDLLSQIADWLARLFRFW